MKVAIITLGCKANQAESTLIEAGLRGNGCEIVDLCDEPDLCIVNTCSVTSKSDYQSRQMIRRASRSVSDVIVTGCYAELNANAVREMDGVKAVVENYNKSRIVGMLTDNFSPVSLNVGSYSKSRFFLKVQDGCNNACSYCVIPRARGRSRSVDPGQIIATVEEISDNHRELVMTGIHLGTYGYDLRPKISLSYLLKCVLSRTKIARIRLSSLEIGEIDDELLEILSDGRICKHLHIPLQSGDDEILVKMKRGYTSRDFSTGIHRIRRRFPEIGLGTDVIGGFPGEGADQFAKTKNLIERLPISYLHVFPYSDRPGTPASLMTAKVDAAEKKERCASLRALSEAKRKAFMSQQIGRRLDLLIEERLNEDCFVGTTGNYLKVRVHLQRPLGKDIVVVRINGIGKEPLLGELIEDA
ncbi:MAG: tRNA (N(6)-L-threonylcarbamoyladenosine(37)-C(2))-methylthiotransferase MtaB [Nitrospirae bacterium]|nr:tRNA (N(6)-L-threonylcarbamoyladenosine(37)-C(2))-methylthiotransferase MtaB [Nitrospirota bacterium]